MMNAQYFIDKFEAIPEEQWTVCTQQDEFGRRCALGHCMPIGAKRKSIGWFGHMTDEGIALHKLFIKAGMLHTYCNGEYSAVAAINNGSFPDYQQGTPKQRILSALRDVQVMEEQDKAVEEVEALTAIPICPECGRPVNKCVCGEEDDDEEEDWGAGSPYEEEHAGPYAPGAFSH